MLPPYNLYWFRIDNKHMTEPWLDQALMDSAYKCDTEGTVKSQHVLSSKNDNIFLHVTQIMV